MTVPLAPIAKIRAAAAQTVCMQTALGQEASSYLTPTLSPQGFLSLLLEGGLYPDAVRFLAHALPVREGVWWGCMAGRALTGILPDGRDAAYAAAEDWVYEPSDANRFACLDAAESAGFSTASAYAALAAFWSGGSLTRDGLPEIAPDPSLAPTGIAASVLLAVAAGDPAQAPALFRRAILQGIEIGNGGEGRRVGVAGPIEGEARS